MPYSLVTLFLALMLLANPAGAFTTSSPTIPIHYRDYNGRLPMRNTVWVCHGSGCNWKVRFTFNYADIARLKAILANPVSAPDERARIGNAIAWAERRVCKAARTCGDKPGASWATSMIRGQLECVDESMNTTSYLLLMQRHGLLKFHKVMPPLHRYGFATFPHWAARIGAPDGTYIVDSYFGKNGERPDVLPIYMWVK